MMRRKEKEITDPLLISAILNEASVCRIGLADGNVPYIVPMSFVYSGVHLYLHSAGEGKKIEILERNNRICFEAEAGVALVRAERGCDFGFRYMSVIGTGTASAVMDLREKESILNRFMEKYAGAGAWEYPEPALRAVTVLCITIETLTAKASGYTDSEMRTYPAGDRDGGQPRHP